jgi:hypothetical protein
VHEHPVRPRLIPVIDTVIICLLALILLFNINSTEVFLWFLLIIFLAPLSHLLPYMKRSPSIAISELANFYVDISIWDVLTGRVPHNRVHPQIDVNHHCPICDNPPSIYRIRGIGDAIGYVLIGIPLLASTLSIKLSAILFGPLLYVGFSFRAKDFEKLSLNAKAQYRSSFKQLWILYSLFGIFLFIAKVIIYSFWSAIVQYWNASPFLSHFDLVVRPAAFLPFHLASFASAVLMLFVTYLVDLVIHRLEDVGETPNAMPYLLRTVGALTRTRQILSTYSWLCFIWLILPWLKILHFPPITFELFPK